ncbi:hypothetical protein MKQ68_14445 [Chitinophaga horti]|uniref:Uncharacterized protein n=1 Tax=Chitinophaga horti TaxID=2920382 RepID=A0ABY6IYY2_9BACT|nr:hypothetical protein [Chitinophaga horti]UYQ91289.1 hypothetical protein MKQ68_14445 [Chitinophaga horti]
MMIRKMGYTLALLALEMLLYFVITTVFMLFFSRFNVNLGLEEWFAVITRRVVVYYVFAFAGFTLLTMLLQPKNKVRAIALINAGLFLLITFVTLYIQHVPLSSAFGNRMILIQLLAAFVVPFMLNRSVNFRTMVALDIFPEKQKWDAAEAPVK